MRRSSESAVLGAIALATLATACSSSDRGERGSAAVRLAASHGTAGVLSTEVTVSGVEVRESDGAWVPIETGFPATVDLTALADAGDTVTFPAALVPEGHYVALQMRITEVRLAHPDGSRATLAPHRGGWTVQIPVDFGVAADHATVVGLNVDLGASLSAVNGEFVFDPSVEIDRIERGRTR